MSTFPNAANLIAPSNEGTFQAAIQAFLARAKELPGGTAQSELTISAGQVTPTGPTHTLDTQGDASTDDLDNILLTNTPAGSLLLVRAANGSRTVVVKNGAGGSGQIFTVDGGDITLDGTKIYVGLLLVGTSWYELFRGGVIAATQAEMEAGSSLTKAVTPGRQQAHPSACKAWVNFNGESTVSIRSDYNVSSITDNGPGNYTVNLTSAMSITGYCVVAGVKDVNAATNVGWAPKVDTYTTSSFRILTGNDGSTSTVLADTQFVTIVVFGDQ